LTDEQWMVIIAGENDSIKIIYGVNDITNKVNVYRAMIGDMDVTQDVNYLLSMAVVLLVYKSSNHDAVTIRRTWE
jgi:hypothetical protein